MNPFLEQRVLRKNAWRLVPILTLAYMINYLDRTAVSFGALTMNRQLGLTATQFGYGAGIFFLGYCFFEIPSNLALYRFGARRWIARIMITWGLVSAASAFVTSARGFYVARFFLGVAEAGFFPGITFYLSAWFPGDYRARILAWFLVAIPVSALIGAPVAGFLMRLNGLGLAGWQWLFVIEAVPAVILGVLVLRLLADKPEDASWLSAEEKGALVEVLAREPKVREKTGLLPALKDPRVLILAGVQFGFTLGSYGVGFWLPQIIQHNYRSGSNFAVSLMSAIPYFFAVGGMLAWAWYIDRNGKSINHLIVTCVLSAVGLAGAAFSGSLWPSIAGITIALIGVTAARAIFWTIPPRFLSGAAAAGGFAFINSLGTVGGFVGPAMMGRLKDGTGNYLMGILAMAAIMVIAAILSASLKFTGMRD